MYEGEVVSCYYFFGTYEYRTPLSNYNDAGKIYLWDGSSEHSLVEIQATDVGNNNCMQHWKKASVIVPHEGLYWIIIQVLDLGDAEGPSFLFVDKFSKCNDFSSIADINNDCDVNLEDLAILCECWTGDMTLKETGEEIFCGIADLNDDSKVNNDDLCVIEENWLK